MSPSRLLRDLASLEEGLTSDHRNLEAVSRLEQLAEKVKETCKDAQVVRRVDKEELLR
jgi:hypothetical protein